LEIRAFRYERFKWVGLLPSAMPFWVTNVKSLAGFLFPWHLRGEGFGEQWGLEPDLVIAENSQ
jgi:hypothetical protein